MKRESRRQELAFFAESGRLRQAVEGKLSADATDLLVDLAIRYCEPRRDPRWKRAKAKGETP